MIEKKFEKIQEDYKKFLEESEKYIAEAKESVENLRLLCERTGFPIRVQILSMNETYSPDKCYKNLHKKYDLDEYEDELFMACQGLIFSDVTGRWWNSNAEY